MFGLVFGIVLILAGLIIGVGGLVSDQKAIGAGSLFGGLILGVLFVILGCVRTVPTGQTGIVTVFGRVENYTLDSGVHFVAPWKSVTKMDNRTQVATIDMSSFSSVQLLPKR